ncbi:transposase [Mucilaginibacter sp. UYCu711]|uniref:transposase n=1 Tax=Mucilaginibacter sp. UYCu711 TaxID=3156339 RepID=UPI003D2423C4
MATRTLHDTTEQTWFVTFTCHSWIALFEIASAYEIVYDWLKLIGDKYNINTFAFVIMPNHVHLLLQLNDEKVNLNKVIGNGKRFMAYAIIQRLTDQKNVSMLYKLSSDCSEKEKAKGQKHKVFESSFDGKPVYNIDFLHQKLNYIHHNPVAGKWNFCNEFTDYPHNSAAFYELEAQHPFILISDYRDYWY